MGCTSSKSVDIKSNMYPRPQQQYSPPPTDNAHLVALTSSTYGFLSVDSQKRADDSKDANDPLNQMYQKMMNLDGPGSQVPQSWSEVSSVLSQLKTEVQHKSSRPAVAGRLEPETIDISELLDNDEEVSTKNPVQQESEKPKPKPAKKREPSVIHTLEEVDKLADSAQSEEVDSDNEEPGYEVPSFYDSPPKRSARGVESAKPDKRYSMSSVVRRPRSINDKPSNKPSKSLSYEGKRLNQIQENGKHQQPPGSTLFDAEFLESFKEAFEQLSIGVPSTKSQPRKPTAKGNKISQPDSQVPTKIPKLNYEEQRRLPVGKVAVTSVKQQAVKHENVQQKTKGNELPAKTMQNKGVFNEADENLKNIKVANLQKAPPSDNEASDRESNSVKSKVAKWQKTQAPPKENAPVKKAPAKKSQPPPDPLVQFPKKCPPGGEQKVVLYSTSLRGIRKTFEDCNTVRNILQSFNVELDERDVSMDSQFKQQLKDLMDKPVPVPRLFIKGRYIGGADEVVQVHESGTLAKLLEGIPCGNLSKDCDGCGGVRFIPCTDCSGSCKAVGADGSVIRCPECNENGLVRCPICS